MSDNQDATSAPTLEEALAEIEGLKEQLSGSDLKVFTQNRELRQENGKLREEVTRLTEECVTQTFAVRGLEKNKASLEKQVAEQQSKIASLEEKISELEARVDELTEQLGIHRSQEIHLSQELERTISTNAEELSRLKTEHDRDLETTRQTLEQARAELEKELSEKLAAKAAEVVGLEKRVEQFKEEFLSQEFVVPTSVAAGEGRAFRLLRAKMEELLGFPGKTLVEQVFRLCGADENTSDPVLLEEAFEALQDTAGKLVRDPETEQELSVVLKSAWQELGLGSTERTSVEVSAVVPEPTDSEESSVKEAAPAEEVSAEPEEASSEPAGETVETHAELESPEQAQETSSEGPSIEEVPAVETVATTEEALLPASEEAELPVAEEVSIEPSLAESEAVTEEDLSPVAEAPEEKPDPIIDSIDEALAQPSVEESPSSEESESVAVEEEAVSEQVALDTSSAEDADEEPSAESEVEVEQTSEQAQEPTSEVSDIDEELSEASEEESSEESSAEDDIDETEADDEQSQEDNDFDKAAAALQKGDFATSWPIFHQLCQLSPHEPTYLVGEIASLVGLERYEEAYALGKGLDVASLEESAEVYKESFETVLLTLAEQTDSLLARKLYLLELVELVDDIDRTAPFLDEIEEIGLRTPREGELSLLQARHRVGQDDVTEHLIEAMSGVSDSLEVFDLMRQNLDRYPELTPLAEFMERLLGASRDEALEAETTAKELIASGESVQELLEELDPSEELVKVFLEHMLPRTGQKIELPSEQFEDLLNESEPAAFVGALRQALRSVDYTLFFEEIDVLSYDGEEHFLLRSSPEPKATLLFGSEVDDVPPEELRFLVLRELFSMVRRHSHLAHMAAQLDDKLRYAFVKACLEIHKEANIQIPESLLGRLEELEELATDEGQDTEFRSLLESGLYALYQATESDAFPELGDFLFDGQLHKKYLDPLADSFAAKQTGLVVASFAIARDSLSSDDFEALEENGFQWLYEAENLEKFRELRFRLQRLWAMPFKALVSDGEE